MAYIFRQPVDWLWHGSFWMNNTPESYGHGLSFYLHDVALSGSDAVLPLLLVRKGEAEAQRRVAKLSLSAVGGHRGTLMEASCLRAAPRPAPPWPQNDWENRVSMNSPSLAVALNGGIASSCLNADVKAFERLQIVRDRDSSYFGSK